METKRSKQDGKDLPQRLFEGRRRCRHERCHRRCTGCLQRCKLLYRRSVSYTHLDVYKRQTQVRTPRQRQRFRSACRGKLWLGVTMPQAVELFGKSQAGRFFAGPTLALDVGGSTAWLAGHANPDELASFCLLYTSPVRQLLCHV